MKERVKTSYTNLNVASLFLSGSHVKLDDWRETLLIDEKPLAIPGANQFIVLPYEIGLQPPNYFTSFPYTGLSLYEEYTASSYIVTGWSVSLGKSGNGPAHVNGNGGFIYSPLTGEFYVRDLNDPSNKNTITPFWIDSGQFFNFASIEPQFISGDNIIGWNIYSGLSGAEDLIVSLQGRYSEFNEDNVNDGVIMSSGDSAISFFLEYGSITGETILEYYSPNEFVATRWGLYSATTGSSTIGNGDPLALNEPLSGRFYYRDPKNNSRETLTTFTMTTGVYASFETIGQSIYIPPRKIIGIDIYKGLNDLSNLHIVLGGRSIASANYFKNVVTKDIFDIFSGYATGLITQSTAGVSFLNSANGAITLNGTSGIEVRGGGFPNTNFDIVITGDFYTNDNPKEFISSGRTIIKDITDDSYNFIKSDIGKFIAFSGTGSEYTGYLNSTGGFVAGDHIPIMNMGTGKLIITGEPGTIVGSREQANSLTNQYSVAEVIYKSDNFWLLYGDLE